MASLNIYLSMHHQQIYFNTYHVPRHIVALGLLSEAVMSESYGIDTAILREDILRILKKSNGVCAVCGKPISINEARGTSWNIEHVIPRTVAKWTLDLTEDELKYLRAALASERNLVITHYFCSVQKSSDFSEECIDTLNVSASARADLHQLVADLKPFIEKYRETVDEIKHNTHCRCEMCGVPITDKFVIRRLDNRFPRSIKNSWLVCQACNMNIPSDRKRIKFSHLQF